MGDVSSEANKKRSIDDIIEHMTADLQSYEGQYIVLGAPGPGQGWGAPPGAPPGSQLFYPRAPVPDEMIGMMDVGGGNFVNVVFSKPPPPPPPPQQPPHDYAQTVGFIYHNQPQAIVQPQNLVQPHLIDYGQRAYNETTTNGCLIENVVGNWAPNLNGTYSPFGNLPKDDNPSKINTPATSCPQMNVAPVKKQRIVAEVKPMRPSYSDVLAKSPPLTPPPTVKQPTKPLVTSTVKTDPIKRQQGKTTNNNQSIVKPSSVLKRQSSSGSDDGKNSRACGERWSSLEELAPSPPPKPPPHLDESLKKRKKNRTFKSFLNLFPGSEKEEKPVETINSKPAGDGIFEKAPMKKAQSLNGNTTAAPPPPPPPPPAGSKNSSSQTSKTPPERVPLTVKPKPPREKEKTTTKVDRGSNSARNSNKTKRTQRAYKKREGSLGALCRKWQEQSSYYAMFLTTWLFNLLWDVTAMSTSLLIHLCGVVYEHGVNWVSGAKARMGSVLEKWKWWGKKGQRQSKKPEAPQLPGSLTHNIVLPTTGEEAMKRLLSCRGKDPYSILGVTSNCTDEEIKKYYKSQALLVHPDKNSQPGAEEAFKILVHAFDLIAEPEKRANYDRYVAETNQVEQAWSELSDLLSQLHEKMEYAANTIRCNNCGKRHKREITERPSYAARYCAQCKIHHAAKEGDMWAESRGWGWGCRYYACMGGAVYDISQWANCQGGGVHRVKPDAHSVQYRVLLGRHHPPVPEPDIEDLLNSLYSQNSSGKRGKKKPKKNK